MFELGRELGLGVVATNDAHYLKREDAEAHDVLLAIGTGADLDDPKRFRFTGSESYVKSEAEMRQLFPDHPETLRTDADGRQPLRVRLREALLPAATSRGPPSTPATRSSCGDLAERGAAARYGDPLPAAVRTRLDYELSRHRPRRATPATS